MVLSQSPEIDKIKSKWITQGWPKFITSINISGIHGFDQQQINFQFPITAIVGENGTGKTTVLKCAACAYKGVGERGTFYPSTFFPDTTWDRLQNVKIVYHIKQGSSAPAKGTLITKRTNRWRGITSRPENNVFWFDINTHPIETFIGFSKLANKTIKEISSKLSSQENISKLSEIMCRDYTNGRYATTSIDEKKEIGVLKTVSCEMSQFHQGAGESNIFDLITFIEKIPDYSLVVIDEIESSLHPKAQRRLIRQLLNVIRNKTLQIIISTHSPYVLSELPPEARILLSRVNGGIGVFYGPSVDFCLSQIDDELHSELDVFVEDSKSKGMISEIIRSNDPSMLQKVRILKVGTADIIWMFENLYKQGRIPYKIIGIVDADMKEMKDILKLPGVLSPEKQVFEDISKLGNYEAFAQSFSMNAASVKKEFDEVQTIQNYREWVARLADKFRMSEDAVWDRLVVFWVRNCLPKGESKEVFDAIKERLEEHASIYSGEPHKSGSQAASAPHKSGSQAASAPHKPASEAKEHKEPKETIIKDLRHFRR